VGTRHRVVSGAPGPAGSAYSRRSQAGRRSPEVPQYTLPRYAQAEYVVGTSQRTHVAQWATVTAHVAAAGHRSIAAPAWWMGNGNRPRGRGQHITTGPVHREGPQTYFFQPIYQVTTACLRRERRRPVLTRAR
jgi:hypothetical protein